MGSIDRRIAEAEGLRQRRDYVAENAPTLFEKVWVNALQQVEEARKKGLVLAASVTPEGRMIQRLGTGAEAHLVLDAERKHILSCAGASETWFDIDVCDNAVICLKLGGRQVSPEEAAKRLLDPLLSPELARIRG